jgi:hypothetical protein
VLGGHFDLIEDGVTGVGHPAAAPPADFPAAVEPTAGLAETVKYLFDILV